MSEEYGLKDCIDASINIIFKFSVNKDDEQTYKKAVKYLSKCRNNQIVLGYVISTSKYINEKDIKVMVDKAIKILNRRRLKIYKRLLKNETIQKK